MKGFSMDEGLIDGKKRTRARVREILNGMTSAAQTKASRHICERILSLELWQQATSVLVYSPVKGEVDVWPLAICAAEQGKTIALPAFENEQHSYTARRIDDISHPLEKGRFGIREPSKCAPSIPLNQLDFILVPAVAFDLRGARLGRGGGFFDRLLEGIPCVKCGVAFDEQIVETLPVGRHDIPMDCVVTPTRWMTFGMRPDL